VHESMIIILPSPTCIARNIAILLYVYCALYDAPTTPLLYAIHHTILVMAISCKRPSPRFGGEHKPFEWGWRTVRLCSPCLWGWGAAVPAAVMLCPRRPGVERSLGGKQIIYYHRLTVTG